MGGGLVHRGKVIPEAGSTASLPSSTGGGGGGRWMTPGWVGGKRRTENGACGNSGNSDACDDSFGAFVIEETRGGGKAKILEDAAGSLP
jgi:hypothetical protein